MFGPRTTSGTRRRQAAVAPSPPLAAKWRPRNSSATRDSHRKRAALQHWVHTGFQPFPWAARIRLTAKIPSQGQNLCKPVCVGVKEKCRFCEPVSGVFRVAAGAGKPPAAAMRACPVRNRSETGHRAHGYCRKNSHAQRVAAYRWAGTTPWAVG